MCDICGLPAIVIEGINGRPTIKECKLCQTDKVSRIDIPFGTKLLNQEFGAMNVMQRIMTGDYKEQK